MKIGRGQSVGKRRKGKREKERKRGVEVDCNEWKAISPQAAFFGRWWCNFAQCSLVGFTAHTAAAALSVRLGTWLALVGDRTRSTQVDSGGSRRRCRHRTMYVRAGWQAGSAASKGGRICL